MSKKIKAWAVKMSKRHRQPYVYFKDRKLAIFEADYDESRVEPVTLIVHDGHGEDSEMDKAKGYWVCDTCDCIKEHEAEVYCWECGKGEMIYTRIEEDSDHDQS